MPTSYGTIQDSNQMGYADGNGIFTGGGSNGNISIGVGQYMYFRLPTFMPAGAIISSAVLKLPFGVKNGNSTQSSNHTIYIHNSSNSPELYNGENVFSGSRSSSATVRGHTITYDQPSNTYSQNATDITTLIQAVYSSVGIVPGGYVTFTVLCNSESGDMNWSVGGSSLEIVYTMPLGAPGDFWDFNFLVNGSFANDTFGWGENEFFGGHQVGGTIARDTSFTFQGRPTLRYTTPAPSGTKQCGPTTYASSPANEPLVFAGWAYVPSSVTVNVYPQFYWDFVGGNGELPRNVWTPFCTSSWTPTSNGDRTLNFTISSGFTQGQNIWLADVAVFNSKFRQRSFSVYSDGKSGRFGHYARQSTSRGTVTRQSIPRSYIKRTSMDRRETYTLGVNGIWIPNNPSKI